MANITEELRRGLRRMGMEYADGRVDNDGSVSDEDSVTTIWPVRDFACAPLRFVETDGGLALEGVVTVGVAIVACAAASIDWRGNDD